MVGYGVLLSNVILVLLYIVLIMLSECKNKLSLHVMNVEGEIRHFTVSIHHTTISINIYKYTS
jgi:hypothetical protein